MNVTIKPQSVQVKIGAQAVGVRTGSPVARYVVEPYVAIEETESGAIITCTAQGETTAGEIYNGKDGQDGATGATPEIFTAATTLAPGSSAYAHVSGTPEQPLVTFGIPRGDTGAAGSDGKDGEDGVSPGITVTDITGGHRVTITDKDHPYGQTFDIMDGEPGTTDYNELSNKPTIPSTAAEVGALPDSTNYAASPAVGDRKSVV